MHTLQSSKKSTGTLSSETSDKLNISEQTMSPYGSRTRKFSLRKKTINRKNSAPILTRGPGGVSPSQSTQPSTQHHHT